MPTKRVICPRCPKCGSRQYQSIRPAGLIAFRKDRQCRVCDTVYSPPTPVWASILFILIGIALSLGYLVSVFVAFRTGWFMGLLSDLVAAVFGLLSLRYGVLSFREEIAVAPESSDPKPVFTLPDFRPWLWNNRGNLLCATAIGIVLIVFVESTRRSLAEKAIRDAQQRTQQQAALKALTQLGGTVMGSDNGRPTAIALERSEETRLFAGQHTATREIQDEDVAVIAMFPELERIFITAPEITDAGLRTLSPQPKLVGFVVKCPRVTEDGLRAISSMDKLEYLDISRTEVRSLSTFELGRKPRLRGLKLAGTRIKNDSVADLVLASALEELDLSATQVDDDGLKSLGKLSQLEKLHLRDTQITDRGLDSLRSLSKLVLLDVSNTGVTETGGRALLQHLPNCTIILR